MDYSKHATSWIQLLETVYFALIFQFKTSSSTTVARGDFVQEDITTHSFGQVMSQQSNIPNALTCVSLCLRNSNCDGVYFGTTSKDCHIAEGGLYPSSDAIYNIPGIRMYRYKTLVAMSCSMFPGFKLMTINGKTYCFYLDKQTVKYSSAQSRCQQKSAVLFHYDDDPDKFVKLPEIADMFGGSSQGFWIGLHSPSSSDSKWYWEHNNQRLTNSELVELSWEDSDFPYTLRRTACAIAKPDLQLIDSDLCTDKEEYMCEIAL